MAGLTVREEFLNATKFRDELPDLQKHLAWDDKNDALPVRIVMSQSGPPIAAVMPYSGYELIRELIFLLSNRLAQASEKELAVDGEKASHVIAALRKKVESTRAPRPRK